MQKELNGGPFRNIKNFFEKLKTEIFEQSHNAKNGKMGTIWDYQKFRRRKFRRRKFRRQKFHRKKFRRRKFRRQKFRRRKFRRR